MNGLNYLLQTNLYLLLFMGFYVLVLRNETFFRQNRFFLNTSIFLSFLIPFINSDWFRDLFITQKVREAAIMPSRMIYDTIVVGINEEASSLSLSDAIFWIYTTGAAILLVRFFIRLALLKASLKAEKGAAFSFFNTLVVDREMPKAETIIDHEKVHMRQWHSADIIFIELAAIVNWFNPVMYLYKKEIRHIHEFIADEEAATLMESKSDYALLLFSNTLGVDPLHLSNNFFNRSLLKRRIMMLHKSKSQKVGLWKYGFSAPLFMLMLIVSAATVQSEETLIRPVAETLLSPLPAETSTEILSALALDKPVPDEISSKPSAQFNGQSSVAIQQYDFTVLKKHFTRSLKYPPFARENMIMGLVIVNFTVKDKKISESKIARGLQTDVNNEVVRVIEAFQETLDVPNATYTVAIKYGLTGLDNPPDFIPGLNAQNYIGQITVIGMPPSAANPKTGELKIEMEGVEVPQFPGGKEALAEYMRKNLRYPSIARDNNMSGTVTVQFVVDTDGSIEDIKVLKGVGGGTDEEAVRVIAQSPKWQPGTKNGVPAKVAYTMPISFGLTADQGIVPNTNQNAIQKSPLPSGVVDFASVEVLPEFAGGMSGWGKYLQANLKYPEQAKKNNITGRVFMSFVVEKDGQLSDIKVLRGLGAGADEEAVRVLLNSPAWKPGIMNGRPVRVAYTMPIYFQLSSKN